MTTSMIIATIIECAVGAFLIWGLFNEDRLVDFEDRIGGWVREYIRRKRKERRSSVGIRKEA